MKYAKSDPRYWSPRLTKRYGAAYYARMRVHREERRVNLRTSSKRQASEAAAELWQAISRHGWDKALDDFGRPPQLTQTTIGEFLKAMEATATFTPRTFQGQSRSLRHIAAEIAGIETDQKAHLAAPYRARVDALPLSKVTKPRVLKWRQKRIQGLSGRALEKRMIAVNRQIINARAFFQPKRLVAAQMEGETNPFEGIETVRRRLERFHSAVPMPALMTAAFRELKGPTLQIFILAATTGMRREEIDKLMWSQVHLGESPSVEVAETPYHRPKADSARMIPVDDWVAGMLKEWKAESQSPFVIAGREPIMDCDWERYRCRRHQAKLVRWLRKKGITANQPLHYLRKEYISAIAAQAGIHAASVLAGHSNIRMTASVYTEHRVRVTAGLERPGVETHEKKERYRTQS